MSDSLLKAISFAAWKHDGQLRKDGKTPYVAHPMRVMTILSTLFGVKDEEMLTAAVLHDTIEDTTADRDDIEQRFGKRVARYVAALTKDKRLPEVTREYRYFKKLGRASIEVKLCKLGDTLDNLLDSRTLGAEHRQKTISKAKRLVKLFGPGFPREWAHALEFVKQQIKELE